MSNNTVSTKAPTRCLKQRKQGPGKRLGHALSSRRGQEGERMVRGTKQNSRIRCWLLSTRDPRFLGEPSRPSHPLHCTASPVCTVIQPTKAACLHC